MAISSILVKINGTTLTGLKGYTVERNKLWTDAGRDMGGNLHSVHVGLFPKLNLEFRPLTDTELAVLIPLLDLPSFTVEWYDAGTNTVKEGLYYSGDYKYSVYRKDTGLYETFTVNLIPYNKMT
jgi:hypothetical protein